jgi:four helix bundle protein
MNGMGPWLDPENNCGRARGSLPSVSCGSCERCTRIWLPAQLFGSSRDRAPAIAANYHASCRARSRKEFIAKLGVVVEEADETELWLDMLLELDLITTPESSWLRSESGELRAIFKASLDTARRNQQP